MISLLEHWSGNILVYKLYLYESWKLFEPGVMSDVVAAYGFLSGYRPLWGISAPSELGRLSVSLGPLRPFCECLLNNPVTGSVGDKVTRGSGISALLLFSRATSGKQLYLLTLQCLCF